MATLFSGCCYRLVGIKYTNRLLLVAEMKSSENHKTKKVVQRLKIVKNCNLFLKEKNRFECT